MARRMTWIVTAAFAFCLAQPSLGQEPAAVKATRKKLQQKVTVNFKDIGTKACFDDIKNEMDPPVAFRIDNASGVSNNTKLTFKAKDKTVETILNEMSDKFGFGWFVYYNPKDANDRYNGWVTIRKSDKGKERGYEAGKEPKGTKTSPNAKNAYLRMVQIRNSKSEIRNKLERQNPNTQMVWFEDLLIRI